MCDLIYGCQAAISKTENNKSGGRKYKGMSEAWLVLGGVKLSGFPEQVKVEQRLNVVRAEVGWMIQEEFQGEATASAKVLRWGCPDELQEQQSGQCGWNRIGEREDSRQ